MPKLLAQINLYPQGGFQGIGPLGLQGSNAYNSVPLFNKAISTTIGVMTIIGIIWFLVMFIGGAIAIIGSGGDKGKLEQARSRMFSAVVGLIVLVTALFLIDILGNILGLDILGSIGHLTSIIK